MSTKDYSWLVDNDRKLLPCQKNKVFLGEPYNPREAGFEFKSHSSPAKWDVNVANTSSATIFRTRFTVDMIAELEDVTLYEGTRFEFNGREYYLAQYVELKKGIPVLDVKMETLETVICQDGDVGVLKCIYPFFGCNSITDVGEQNVIENNVFSGGFGMEKFIADISDAYELKGSKVNNDVGYELLAECRNTGKMVDVQFVDSFMTGVEEFLALCVGIDRIIDRGDFFQLKILLVKLL